MKKIIIFGLVNQIAFSVIMASIRSEFGMAFYMKIIVPAILIFATNFTAALTVFYQCSKNKENLDKINKTGDGLREPF
jgi:hypothetical protein